MKCAHFFNQILQTNIRPFLFCHSFSIISIFSKKNCVSGPVIIVASLGTNPMPVPDCSVVTHSDILVAPTTLTLEVAPKESNEEMDSVCDDPHLIKKVCLYLTANILKVDLCQPHEKF